MMRQRGKWVIATAGGLVALGLISCATLNRVMLAPPQIPGAKFIGSAACGDCHDNISSTFKTADHARLPAKGNNAIGVGCESCHGPGSLHNDAGGGRNNIINPRRSPEICFQCHLDKRGQFNLPSHHPVLEGRVSCVDCHDPHNGPAIAGGARSPTSENDTCLKCHPAESGPFVFEHEAVREGCTTCHNPHGSVSSRLLTERNANLCLKCHFQRQTGAGQIVIGTTDHTAFLSHGTCYSAGCHEAVHGSQVSAHLRF